jgi:1,4-alpha-glucan branching enzyme
MGVILSKQVGS